jgi:hypothetical protein
MLHVIKSLLGKKLKSSSSVRKEIGEVEKQIQIRQVINNRSNIVDL